MQAPIFFIMFFLFLMPSLLSTLPTTNKIPIAIAISALIMMIITIPFITETNAIMIISTNIVIIIINTSTALRWDTHGLRSALLTLNLAAGVFFYTNTRWFNGFNTTSIRFADWATRNHAFAATLPAYKLHNALVIASGLAFVTFAINNPIALILKQSDLMPVSGNPPKAKTNNEPARGKMIGYLERMIVFLLVVTGNMSGIGLVLAAKAFARFRQLDDKDFAEYVLIGTLLSIGMTIMIGMVLGNFLLTDA
jgi:hypothetical protein